MGRRRGAVRVRRNVSAGLAVAVVGAASYVGAPLLARLARRDDVGRLVAVDSVRGGVDGVTWRIMDVTDPALVTRLTGCEVVVHAAVDGNVTEDAAARSRHNVRSTQTVLTASAAAGARRVVVVSSAMVYGALPDNPLPLPDGAPLRAAPDGPLIGDLLEIEALCERSPRAHPGMAVTVVRPAALVGPGVDTALTRHFEAPRLLVVRGSTPVWQFCHVDDLAAAVETAVTAPLDGPLSVACDGWLTHREVEALSGRASIELPAAFAFGTADRLHRLHVTPVPGSELHYVTYPWAVSAQRLRAAGWKPGYDNATALELLLEAVAGRHALASRRIGRRETATLGAGATVAVLGTAAVVRRARRRRR